MQVNMEHWRLLARAGTQPSESELAKMTEVVRYEDGAYGVRIIYQHARWHQLYMVQGWVTDGKLSQEVWYRYDPS